MFKNKKKFIITFIIINTTLLSSCNIKLWWETNISTNSWKLEIKTNSNTNTSIWIDEIKSQANNAKKYLSKKAKFLYDIDIFEKIYNKAKNNISNTSIDAINKSIKIIEKKYNLEIEKNPSLKENIKKINELIIKTKKSINSSWITKEVKENFEEIKNNIDNLRKNIK